MKINLKIFPGVFDGKTYTEITDLENLSVSEACKILGVSRATYNRELKKENPRWMEYKNSSHKEFKITRHKNDFSSNIEIKNFIENNIPNELFSSGFSYWSRPINKSGGWEKSHALDNNSESAIHLTFHKFLIFNKLKIDFCVVTGIGRIALEFNDKRINNDKFIESLCDSRPHDSIFEKFNIGPLEKFNRSLGLQFEIEKERVILVSTFNSLLKDKKYGGTDRLKEFIENLSSVYSKEIETIETVYE